MIDMFTNTKWSKKTLNTKSVNKIKKKRKEKEKVHKKKNIRNEIKMFRRVC